MLQVDPRRHTDVAGTAARPLNLLSVGRLHWKRGIEYGLEAVRLALAAGVRCRLRVAGGGDFEDAVRFAVAQLGLESHVELLGQLPPEGVRDEMTRADVLLHPAVSEGFSLVAAEAQALGLPIVATDADGLRENLADGESGFVVPRRRPDALADCIARLAGDVDLRHRLGAAGRRRAETLFHPDVVLSRFDLFYEAVANGTFA